MTPKLFASINLAASDDPIAVLDDLARRSPAKARQGLAMAINDYIEMSYEWPNAEVAAIDVELTAAELPTLTSLRTRFSSDLRRVLKRGKINNEVEYYTVRNAVEILPDLSERFWLLLAQYEAALT